MSDWTRQLAETLGMESLNQPWLAMVLATVAATVVIHFVAERLLRRALRAAERSDNVWDDALLLSISRPLGVLIWVVGLALAVDFIRQHSGNDAQAILSLLPKVREVGVILCLAWFLLRLIRRSAANYVRIHTAQGDSVDRTTVDALAKLGRLSVLISSALIVMQTLGFSVSGVLAAGGIGGIAIGFAAKDLLANFFGGLTIYLDRPFSVGDWIRSPDKRIEGTVEAISWRHTQIRGFNKNPIYVPNAVFTTIVVENPSRMSHRRIKETIGIRYDDLAAMPAIVDEVREMLRTHPEIASDQTLIVNFNEFADSSLNFFIYTFTKTKVWVDYHAVKQDVLLRVADIIASHGAEIAFPTRTLHLESGASELQAG